MENENINGLQENENECTINSIDDTAEGRTSEDTVSSQYVDVLGKQSELVNQLIEQNKSLTNQIATLIRNGAHVNDGKNSSASIDDASSTMEDFRDEFIPLEELGKMMYKKE